MLCRPPQPGLWRFLNCFQTSKSSSSTQFIYSTLPREFSFRSLFLKAVSAWLDVITQSRRWCFKCITISVDTARVEPRGWAGSNDHFPAPEFSHSCHLHPKQLVSKGPATYRTHSLMSVFHSQLPSSVAFQSLCELPVLAEEVLRGTCSGGSRCDFHESIGTRSS